MNQKKIVITTAQVAPGATGELNYVTERIGTVVSMQLFSIGGDLDATADVYVNGVRLIADMPSSYTNPGNVLQNRPLDVSITPGQNVSIKVNNGGLIAVNYSLVLLYV